MTIKNYYTKNFLLFLALLFFAISQVFAQKDSVFTISGKISGLNTETWVWLQNADEGEPFADSVKTEKGEFIFKGQVKNPNLYHLKIGKSTKETFPIFVENALIRVNCDYKYPFGCEVIGSYNQLLMDEFAIKEKIIWNPEVIENLQNTYSNFNEKVGYIRKQRFSEALKSFGMMHSGDKAIAYLTSTNSNYILDEELQIIYEGFSEKLKKSIFAQEIKAEIEMRNATKIGRKLVDIKQNDLNGEKISLWDFRDKYVLLYFWASGFEPARRENLKLKKLYDKYKDWDFEVMAVSLDSLENDWNRAVMEDNLNWNNLSDLKGWNNEIAKKLNIQAIPYTILLDREGTIIGKDLRPEELDNILNLIKATRDAAPASSQKKNNQPFFKKIFPKKNKSKAGSLPGAST